MTVVTGDEGYIVIDPLVSVECAAEGMRLVREHLGARPVTAVVYTHSHVDHFGGVKGVVDPEDIRSGRVAVVAPEGFMEHAGREYVYAGNAMSRRSHYMYGMTLRPGPRGLVSTGLGTAASTGTVTLLAPTDLISRTGEERVLDGVRFTFQFTPGAEAPAEMNFHLPQLRALCMAEIASHTLHNLYTPRGAEVRDAVAWSRYLHEALQLYGDDSDVLFISHHWPVWGREQIADFLAKQRDLYRFLHDETLRLAAHGFTMDEIAERVELPEEQDQFWSSRGYYGTVHHNVKAVYQRYLGWFDSNPAHLAPHEPAEAARRYVDFMGGADAVLAKARESFEAGDYRWVAEVVHHVVFHDPANDAARALQADALEQLGYQAESAPWRNFYLTGADELRHGIPDFAPTVLNADVLDAMTSDMLLDYLAVRLNGPKAAGHRIDVRLHITDTDERLGISVRHGVLVPAAADDAPDTSLTRSTLALLCLGALTAEQAHADGSATTEGDREPLAALLGLCDTFRLNFPIVTP
ncbi:alkyl/aryl-sulfatase [Streptomyces fractus]|uniref:alkyl/aryl-sulfatase n=1 Tax=Streptomyces fractus TaxID=641806 RepID=UPI003CF64E61